jgi:hypothetical protein
MSRYRILLIFAAIGFCVGLVFMGLGYAAAHGSLGTQLQIDAFVSTWGRILCPVSSSFMDLANEDMNAVGFTLATLIFSVENAIVYGLVGTVVGEIWFVARQKKTEEPE